MEQPLLVIGNKNYSSWSMRGWLAARKSGMAFAEKRLPMDTPTFAAEIGRYSPTRRVPVLIDGSVTIWDSMAIALYVNETYAQQQLWPQDSTARATAQSITAEMHSGFATLRHRMPVNIRAQNRVVERTAALDADIERVKQLWRDCRESFGAGGGWLFGNFSIADAFYAPVVFRFLTYGVALDAVEQAYVDHLLADADVQAWVRGAIAETEVIEAEEVGQASQG